MVGRATAQFDSVAGLRGLISTCNEAGAIARDHGLDFGIHNHWWEFEPVEGIRPIRLLHESLHPDIFWQLDVYWAQTAGADPAEVIPDLTPRLGSHPLERRTRRPRQADDALGQGTVHIPRILRAVSQPVNSVIELDEIASDPLEAASESLRYLGSLQEFPASH